LFGPGLGSILPIKCWRPALQLDGASAIHVACLLLGRQRDAGQAEVAQALFDDGLLRLIKLGKIASPRPIADRSEQLLVCPFRCGTREQRQQAVVGVTAARRCSSHRIQVAGPGVPLGAGELFRPLSFSGFIKMARSMCGGLSRSWAKRRGLSAELLDGRLDVLGTDAC